MMRHHPQFNGAPMAQVGLRHHWNFPRAGDGANTRAITPLCDGAADGATIAARIPSHPLLRGSALPPATLAPHRSHHAGRAFRARVPTQSFTLLKQTTRTREDHRHRHVTAVDSQRTDKPVAEDRGAPQEGHRTCSGCERDPQGISVCGGETSRPLRRLHRCPDTATASTSSLANRHRAPDQPLIRLAFRRSMHTEAWPGNGMGRRAESAGRFARSRGPLPPPDLGTSSGGGARAKSEPARGAATSNAYRGSELLGARETNSPKIFK